MLNGMKSLSFLTLALALNVTTSVTARSTSTWTAQSRREPLAFARNNIYANAQGGKRRRGGMGTTALMDTESEERPPLYVENSAADVTNRKLSLDETNAGFACPLGADETRVASDVPTLALDPKKLELVPRCDSLALDEDDEGRAEECAITDTDFARYPTVKMIRGAGPYIATHRGELAVLHIPGDLLGWSGFVNLMDDIALCWLLGMKIVIVVGCRQQVDDRNGEGTKRSNAHIRVTDSDTLRILEEEAGFVRFEIERQLNRCLRLHGGGDVSKTPNAPNGNVMSGNFFSSKPFGVIDGVDYQHTGRPKHLNVKRVVDIVKNGDIVLLTPVGIGPTGEGMNVNSESLAAFVAASLCANKVIYCSNESMLLKDKNSGKAVQNFRVKDSLALLEHFEVNVHENHFLTVGKETERRSPREVAMLMKLGWATRALQDGVERAHIIAPTNGALIEELFTAKDGTGTCISHDTYESVHPEDDSGDNEMSNRHFREEFVSALAEEREPNWPKAIGVDFQ